MHISFLPPHLTALRAATFAMDRRSSLATTVYDKQKGAPDRGAPFLLGPIYLMSAVMLFSMRRRVISKENCRSEKSLSQILTLSSV